MTLEPEIHKQYERAIRRLYDESQYRDTAQQHAIKEVKLLARLFTKLRVISEIVETPPSTDEDIDILNQRQRYLEQRIRLLERKLNMRPSREIENGIKTTFSDIPIIKQIYVKSEQSSVPLIIVYNSESITDAIKQIQPGLIKLKDEFPDVHFEPHIFHVDDFHKGYRKQSKLIFGR